jgi:hypothetical protein
MLTNSLIIIFSSLSDKSRLVRLDELKNIIPHIVACTRTLTGI